MFMKSILATAAAVFAGGSAMAAPYVNVEANAGLTGSNYVGTVTEAHVGYEGKSGIYGYYGQVGPALVTPNSGSTTVQVSGKVGGSVAATENLSVYGEYWLLTGSQVENLTSNFKAGLKYTF
jgi:hypothetical protein